MDDLKTVSYNMSKMFIGMKLHSGKDLGPDPFETAGYEFALGYLEIYPRLGEKIKNFVLSSSNIYASKGISPDYPLFWGLASSTSEMFYSYIWMESIHLPQIKLPEEYQNDSNFFEGLAEEWSRIDPVFRNGLKDVIKTAFEEKYSYDLERFLKELDKEVEKVIENKIKSDLETSK